MASAAVEVENGGVRGVRFPVQSVTSGLLRYSATSDSEVRGAWSRFGAVEAVSSVPPGGGRVLAKHNMLAQAVHTAFYEHLPLRLSPDAIWITIAQGLALHINQDPEHHRSTFVSHEGKEKIVVAAPGVSKGREDSNWPAVFPLFAAAIGERTKGDLLSLIECSFSTTSEADRIVSQIALMDAMQNYFEYELMCGCGIPYIELLGTPEDWKSIRQRAESLEAYGLGWWTEALLPVLDEFVAASSRNPRRDFWVSICNLDGASGIRKPITGWIQVFFPYLLAGKSLPNHKSGLGPELAQNKRLGAWRQSVDNGATGDLRRGFGAGEGCGPGVNIDRIPLGISKAPFRMEDVSLGKSFDMLFLGGLSVISQDPEDGCLQPRSGWAVVEDPAASGVRRDPPLRVPGHRRGAPCGCLGRWFRAASSK